MRTPAIADISVETEGDATDVTPAVVVAVVAPAPAPVERSGSRADHRSGDRRRGRAFRLRPPLPAKAAPQAPADPIDTPVTADAAPAKQQAAPDAAIAASMDKTAPRDDSQKAAALKAAGLSDAPETKSPAPTDRNAAPGKVKPEHHATPRARATRRRRATRHRQPIPPPNRRRPRHINRSHKRKPLSTPRRQPAPRWPNAPNSPQPQPHRRSSMPARLRRLSISPLTPRRRLRSRRWRRCASIAPPTMPSRSPASRSRSSRARRTGCGASRSASIRPSLGASMCGSTSITAARSPRASWWSAPRRSTCCAATRPQLERALQHAGLNTEGGLEFSLRDQNFANREQAPRDGSRRG